MNTSAQNARQAASMTNRIKALKLQGLSHDEAKAKAKAEKELKRDVNTLLVKNQYGQISGVREEILSDGSKVYNLYIGNVEIACTNYSQAWRLWGSIEKTIGEAIDIREVR